MNSHFNSFNAKEDWMRNDAWPQRLTLLLAALAGLTAASVRAEEPALPAAAAIDGPAIFERLKSLTGEWQGVWEPGSTPTTVTYSLTGNGSALVEDYRVGETTMSTVYHLDRQDLMLTHYCSAGNQPRMKASSVGEGGRHIEFELLDVTNLTGPGYSKRLELTLIDDNHASVHYTGARTGRRSGVELERVR